MPEPVKVSEPLRQDGILIFKARTAAQAEAVLDFLVPVHGLSLSGCRIMLNQYDAPVLYDARAIDIFRAAARGAADMLAACSSHAKAVRSVKA
jgi:hypothetical protein